MAVHPQDILADDADFASCNQVTIRKGTIAAALANVEIILAPESNDSEKAEAKQVFLALVKKLHQTTFARHLVWKHPDIQKIIAESEDD